MPLEHLELPDAIVLAITGRHSERYLQARLTNDVCRASAEVSVRAAALAAQGRVEAIGLLFRPEPERWLFLIDGGDRSGVRNAVARFKVAEQAEITDVSSAWRLCHITAPAAGELAPFTGERITTGELTVTRGPAEGWAIRNDRLGTPGVDLLTPRAPLGEHHAEPARGCPISSDEVIRRRILADRPVFPAELNEETLLAEIPLEPIVSFTKGCYVGQEVVARLDAYGRPPRLLRRLEVHGGEPLPPGTPVLGSDGRREGEIRSSVVSATGDETLAFASIRAEVSGPLEVLGRPARFL